MRIARVPWWDEWKILADGFTSPCKQAVHCPGLLAGTTLPEMVAYTTPTQNPLATTCTSLDIISRWPQIGHRFIVTNGAMALEQTLLDGHAPGVVG